MGPDIECGGFTFVSNFDSGNLARVELVPKKPTGEEPTKQGNNVEEEPLKPVNNVEGSAIMETIADKSSKTQIYPEKRKRNTVKRLYDSAASSTTTGKKSPTEEIPDFEFNIWTKPDCGGTEYENSNRTWFYFGIKGGAPFSLVKLNIVNLNKQTKMYSQGMAPVYRIVPGRNHWDRIKDKPTFVVEENVFTLTFKYRTLENIRATTYFAFTYPYSYVEVQNILGNIDARFKAAETSHGANHHLDDIYYHRECVVNSLEGRRIDLLTISSRHNISSERETRLKNLFPDTNTPRPFRFFSKKVVFVSARVHPGETPSSFVFNGLLNLLLSKEDSIAAQLRKLYVFKLVPMLNPDGVSNGHYRTDTRGVNLNRVYLNPSCVLHPSVYAARALIKYYHHGKEMEDNISDHSFYISDDSSTKLNLEDGSTTLSVDGHELSSAGSSSPIDNTPSESEKTLLQEDENATSNVDDDLASLVLEDKIGEEDTAVEISKSDLCNKDESLPVSQPNFQESNNPMQTTNIFSSIRESIIKTVIGIKHSDTVNLDNAAVSVMGEGLSDKPLIIKELSPEPIPVTEVQLCEEGSEGSIDETGSIPPCPQIQIRPDVELEFSDNKRHICEPCNNVYGSTTFKSGGKVISCIGFGETTPDDSGLYLYVDLHGHASKKGIFMYGNHFDDVVDCVECMLLPKIMSLNSPNFHFTACNFTERNMYLRDRRDGLSREGSGRVAVLKATGLVRSYTLECNYNTGRLVNSLPPCTRDGTKPVTIHVVPPKYSPTVFEEVGRALGVSILDLTGSNPWSRLPNSQFHTLTGIRDWLKANYTPDQLYVQKMLRKKNRHSTNTSQVVCVAGVRPIHPSGSGCGNKGPGRSTGNKHDNNFSRNRRLAPLMSKTADAKKSRTKRPGKTNITVKSGKDISENVEDSERKENMSSFQIISPPQSPTHAKLAKVFPGPKENIGPGSSQRCPGTSRKFKSNQGTNHGVLKQVLAVRTKCAAGALSGNSKKKANSVRTQRISTLGPIGIQKKGNMGGSMPCRHPSKFHSGNSLGIQSNPETNDGSDFENEQVEKRVSKQGSAVIPKPGTSNEKMKYNKDEPRNGNEQVIIKQGPKRLKISQINTSITEGCQQKNDDSVAKLVFSDTGLFNLDKEKKTLKCGSASDRTKLVGRIESQNLNEEDLTWDAKEQPEIMTNEPSRHNSLHLQGKGQRKLKNIPKVASPIVESDYQGSSNTSKVKYSTKAEKQGKGKVPHLTPIKTFKKSSSFGKKTNSDLAKKRAKVSLRNLASSVSKFRASISADASQGGHPAAEKKRKKAKPKFL